MDLKKKMEKFNKRWSIQTEVDYQEEFQKFRTRILNIFRGIDSHLPDESVRVFCSFYGIPENWTYEEYGSGKWSKNVENKLRGETDEKEFYKLLEVIFSLNIQTSMGYMHDETYSKRLLYGRVHEAINFSNVNVSVGVDKEGEVIFYPKGEEKLDKELVDKIFGFLDEKSNEHFVEALKFYQNKKWIKSAESLRRTLEEFLKHKLNNKKGLAENKLEVGKKLKEEKADSQIRNIISQIFGYLDQYFNENSKHNDGDIDEADNEFLVYQTGLLLRYLNKIL